MFFLKSNFIIRFYRNRQFRPHNQCSHTYKVMHCVWQSWSNCFIVPPPPSFRKTMLRFFATNFSDWSDPPPNFPKIHRFPPQNYRKNATKFFGSEMISPFGSFPYITRTGFWRLPSDFLTRETYGLTRETLPWLGRCKVSVMDFTPPECKNQTEPTSPE